MCLRKIDGILRLTTRNTVTSSVYPI